MPPLDRGRTGQTEDNDLVRGSIGILSGDSKENFSIFERFVKFFSFAWRMRTSYVKRLCVLQAQHGQEICYRRVNLQ
jgi:hypothetical protein